MANPGDKEYRRRNLMIWEGDDGFDLAVWVYAWAGGEGSATYSLISTYWHDIGDAGTGDRREPPQLVSPSMIDAAAAELEANLSELNKERAPYMPKIEELIAELNAKARFSEKFTTRALTGEDIDDGWEDWLEVEENPKKRRIRTREDGTMYIPLHARSKSSQKRATKRDLASCASGAAARGVSIQKSCGPKAPRSPSKAQQGRAYIRHGFPKGWPNKMARKVKKNPKPRWREMVWDWGPAKDRRSYGEDVHVRVGKKTVVVSGPGRSDYVRVWKLGDELAVLSINERLEYAALRVADVNDNSAEAEAYLENAEQIEDVLGKKGLDLKPTTIRDRLFDYMWGTM